MSTLPSASQIDTKLLRKLLKPADFGQNQETKVEMSTTTCSKRNSVSDRQNEFQCSPSGSSSLCSLTQMSTDPIQLQQLCADRERQLRTAAANANVLRTQLEQLRQRRQAAKDAATAMARRVAREQHLQEKRIQLRQVDQQIDHFMNSAKQQQQRPKAAIEPFKVSASPARPTSLIPEIPRQTALLGHNNNSSNNNNDNSNNTNGSKPPIVLTVASMQHEVTDTTTIKAVQYGVNGDVIGATKPPSDRDSLSSSCDDHSTSNQSNSITSSPVKSQQQPKHRKVTRSINQLLKEKMKTLEIQEDQIDSPSTTTTTTESESQPTTAPNPPDVIPAVDKAMLVGKQQADSDTIHIRNDTIRAVKRRSWAHEMDGTCDEAEHIRAVLRREQMKGKSHINFGFIFGQICEKFDQQQQQHISGAEIEIRPPPPYTPPEELARKSKAAGETDSSAEETSSSGSQSPRAVVVESTTVTTTTIKGILKGVLNERRHSQKRSLRFDPLALLLDAALEGELEMVKTCAKQIGDVSRCNDEGITALHNAICAGHYDIVRFLVDAGADVNAQDSDGWTPLHCAASCNNLPMVKFLVERGACVFATTLSDHETPAEKCEEGEDGYDGCSQFLFGIQEKMGRMCEGVVYAAYDFEPKHDDELPVCVGERLRVLDRDQDREKGWWWCRKADADHTQNETRESDHAEGYIPRNYLSLYPRIMPSTTTTDNSEKTDEARDQQHKNDATTNHESADDSKIQITAINSGSGSDDSNSNTSRSPTGSVCSLTSDGSRRGP